MSSSSYLRRFKTRLLERGDEWKCHYCGVLFVPENTVNGDPEYYTDKPRQGYFMMHADGSVRPIYRIKDGFCDNPTVDHIHPRSRGGGNELSNLVFACHLCNSKKNNREGWQLAVSE